MGTDGPDDAWAGWEAYPNITSSHSSMEYDPEFYDHRFKDDASRLFSRQGDYMVSYLWPRTEGTYEDCLHGFGFKIQEDCKIWDGFQARMSPTGPYHELCYTIRFYEKNGRPSGNPWSLRQTGIYQQLDMSTGKSTWIFLQPSRTIQNQARKITHTNLLDQRFHHIDPLSLHKLFISTGLNTFGDYLEVLQEQLRELSHKASFSGVAKKRKNELPLDFSDLQKLQLLKQKLTRTSAILVSYQDLAMDFKTLCQVGHISVKADTAYQFDMCISQTKVHLRRVQTALSYSEEISHLLSRILSTRHDEILLNTNVTMQGNLKVMERISSESQHENRTLSQIAAQTYKDSKTLKALTMIATTYLPASLVA
ncbi:hypothetical protein FQN49_003963 [Arthroderma sp. PD_2]|nr:hypothetical protein FQN49_003963 [Arthroderma sp. PD_2]